MAAKSAEERFEMACAAISKLQDVSALMYDSAIFNSSVSKNLSELVTFLSTGVMILNPDRGAEFIKEANERATRQNSGAPEASSVQKMSEGYL